MSTTFKPNVVVTITDVLTTELNALANNTASAASTVVIDNTTQLCFWMDLELTVQFLTAPTVNNPVEIYLVPAVNGTDYVDSAPPAPNLFLGAFLVQAVTSAQRLALIGIPIPPLKFKLVAKNASGFAFPATGSKVRYTLYNETGV